MSDVNHEYVNKCIAENPDISPSRFVAFGIPSLVNGVRIPYSGIRYNSSSKGIPNNDLDKDPEA